MAAVMGVFAWALWHEFTQIQQQIRLANQQVAKNNVQIAKLEAWVRAQMAFTEQGLTAEEAQAINQTFPPVQESNAEIQTVQQPMEKYKR
jgi:hypothetical protein